MVWKDWWPYDPHPVTSATDPYLVTVEKNKVYWWCACGKSKMQPWCDGSSHRGSPFKPLMYIPAFSGKKLMDATKIGSRKPLEYGSHLWVKCNNNTGKSALALFGICFCLGTTTTWLFHR